MKKLVIFDFDGTLMDTIEDLVESINIMLRQHDLNEVASKDVRILVGLGAEDIIKKATRTDGFMAEMFIKEFKEIYANNYYEKSVVYDGIKELCTSLRKKGYLLAIISNKDQNMVEFLCQKHLSECRFDAIYGKTSGLPYKPDRKAGELLLDKLNVEKENCIMIGDAESDITFAKNLGILSILVLWGYRTKTELLASGAKLFAETPGELENEITAILN